MENYGFVYLWFDRKHKRYYVGCRWGNINDGYICSSVWMKNSYKRRSQDFKRKILSYVYTNKKDLLQEEYRYLSMIKEEELGVKYYNLSKRHFGHWSTLDDKEKIKSIKQKQKDSWTPERKTKQSNRMKNRLISEETKEKNRQAAIKQFSDPKQKEIARQAAIKQFSDPKQKEIARENMLLKWKDPIFIEKNLNKKSMLGKTHTKETKEKMSLNNAMKNPTYRDKQKKSKKGIKWYINKEGKKKMAIPNSEKHFLLLKNGYFILERKKC